jgi:phage shock protein PspC (stress-responsive transcriptional regulator)
MFRVIFIFILMIFQALITLPLYIIAKLIEEFE